MWFNFVTFSTINLLEIAYALHVSVVLHELSQYASPATKEKSDPGGNEDGRTSGIEMDCSIACLSGRFENEWIYGYIVCFRISSVLGSRHQGDCLFIDYGTYLFKMKNEASNI